MVKTNKMPSGTPKYNAFKNRKTKFSYFSPALAYLKISNVIAIPEREERKIEKFFLFDMIIL